MNIAWQLRPEIEFWNWMLATLEYRVAVLLVGTSSILRGTRQKELREGPREGRSRSV